MPPATSDGTPRQWRRWPWGAAGPGGWRGGPPTGPPAATAAGPAIAHAAARAIWILPRTTVVSYRFSIMGAPARQLPRGRHELTREAIAASQRARLLDAVSEAVAEK